MKFLIAGTGGVGGSIGGFLALAGEDVICIARGENLKAIREKGLHLKSDLKGDHFIPVKACTAEDYSDKADVIIVSVKQYSLNSMKNLFEKATHPGTLILPILNVYNTSGRIKKLVPHANVLDGCIYIVGFVSGAGEITQMGKVFKLIFGSFPEDNIDQKRLEDIAEVLRNAGIKVIVSDDIRRDTFMKWSFISAMACTGAYYDTIMEPIQHPGPERDTYSGLASESAEIGRKLGIKFTTDVLAAHLRVMDALDPQSTASMQKDIARGHQSEIQGLLFDIIDLGKELDIPTPTYDKVAAKLSTLVH